MSEDEQPQPELLGSDDLGEVGETEFHSLAAKAPLIVNEAIRDRAGWDFVVQAPAENPPDATLDDREVLWTSYIQVKATWNDRKPSIRLSLSAAEKLAKHKAATFIAVLLYDRVTRDCTGLYLVELTGNRLAMILKALREHQSQGARSTNETPIYVHLRADERLGEIEGPAIRDRLARAHRRAGPDGYPAMKTRELKTIGWGEERLRGVITLHDVDQGALFDVLLGKRSWKATLSDFVETRFDIALPARNAPSGLGNVRFTPAPQAQCELVVSWKGSGGRLSFNGDHHHLTLPGPKGLESRSRLCFAGFTVEYGEGRVRLQTTTSETPAPRMTLMDWRRFWRLMEAFRHQRADFVLRSPLFKTPVMWSYAAAPDEIASDVGQTLMAVKAAGDLDEDLDLRLGAIRMEEIAPWAKGIVMARHFGMPGKPHFTFTISSRCSGDAGHDRSPQDGVYIDFIDLGEHRVAFAIRLRMVCKPEDDEDVWASSRAHRVDVRRIDRSEEAFAAFTEEAKTLAGLDKIFLGDIDEDFLRRALGDISEF